MNLVDIGQVIQSLILFSSATRLYELRIGDAQSTDLLVEAFTAEDAIQELGARTVIALSTNAFIPLTSLLNEPASLLISLPDGTRSTFSGFITEASLLSCDGGFARFCLRIAPWMWKLEQIRNCRVWENKTVVQIIDEVFWPYQPDARWRWTSETYRFMEKAVERSYCCQYRESDFDFIRRLLTEEGLCWRFEQGEFGPCCVIFSDSTELFAVPYDPSSARGDGVRFHGARPGEAHDTVQAMHVERNLVSTSVTTLSTNYKSRYPVTATSPGLIKNGRSTTEMEVFDNPGAYAYTNDEQARRYADIHMETLEARALMWRGRSTVRTLRAGTRMIVTGLPMKRYSPKLDVMVTRVVSMGINNFPPKAQQALAELFGPLLDDIDEIENLLPLHDAELLAAMRKQALESGYANCFEAIPALRPWRAQLPGAEAGRHPKPTAYGAQTAIVVGPGGITRPNGARELHCDRLGRVRIRFHWQDDTASCWVRVAQRAAGGSKAQFLPRIGQEVLVEFMENNIDRPVIIGALYNGQGEGGNYATPGGKLALKKPLDLFQRATDHVRNGQGNASGGNSPAWHGASPDSGGHRNNAAQWGIRTKEFGGWGYNQLLFDDTNAQGRVQLKCSSAGSELNLGHLIHTADNYRGSFRGLGAELRTDAYGVVRGGKGVLITSYGVTHNTIMRDPVGENSAGIAMLEQATQLTQKLHEAAKTHLTVGLAAFAGTVKPGASVMDDAAAPLKSLVTTLSGMVDRDGRPLAPPEEGVEVIRVPHLAQPVIAVSAQGGLVAVAGQDMQIAARDAIALISGGDTQFSTGGQLRLHAQQAIGILGGAVKPAEDGIGLHLIAAQDDIELQAQAATLTVQARDDVNVISANAHIDWAAAKSISLSTAGGANITIAGGNITVQCPGKLTIHAGMKDFGGPARMSYAIPKMPLSNMPDLFSNRLDVHDVFAKHAFSSIEYIAKRSDNKVMRGVLDPYGRTAQLFGPKGATVDILSGPSPSEWDMHIDPHGENEGSQN
jgi:type VI secretion system secreted protein VgrG